MEELRWLTCSPKLELWKETLMIRVLLSGIKSVWGGWSISRLAAKGFCGGDSNV